MTARTARQRYSWRIVVLMTAYVALLIGAELAFPQVRGRPVLAYALAIVPALPILGVFWAIGRLMLEERDEYVRHLLVRQAMIATAFMLSVATVWGFLESFGLAPHVDAYAAAVLWFAGLGVGGLVNWLAQPRAIEEPA